MTTPVRYFGGKARMAPALAALLPPHRVYLEPYMGSAAVLFAKQPSTHELLNDANGSVVAFFTALRDDPDELERLCRLTPYSRDEYLAADLFTTEPLTTMERARRFWVRSSQSMSGIVEARTTWSGSARSGASRARTTVRKLDGFAWAAERLLGCIFDHRDALDFIARHAMRDDAAMYVDPPYMRKVRQGPGGYAFDAEDADHHRALAELLTATPAFVALSGYRCDLYDELYDGWHVVELPTIERAGQSRTKGDRTEVVWCNRNVNASLL